MGNKTKLARKRKRKESRTPARSTPGVDSRASVMKGRTRLALRSEESVNEDGDERPTDRQNEADENYNRNRIIRSERKSRSPRKKKTELERSSSVGRRDDWYYRQSPRHTTDSDSMSIVSGGRVPQARATCEGGSADRVDGTEGLFAIPTTERYEAVVARADETMRNHYRMFACSRRREKLHRKMTKLRIKISASSSEEATESERTVEEIQHSVVELNEMLKSVSSNYNTKQLLFNRIKLSQAALRIFFPVTSSRSCFTPEEKQNMKELVGLHVVYNTHCSGHLQSIERLQMKRQKYRDKQKRVQDEIEDLRAQVSSSRAEVQEESEYLYSECGDILGEWEKALTRAKSRLLLRCHVHQLLIGNLGSDWSTDGRILEAALFMGKLISRHTKS